MSKRTNRDRIALAAADRELARVGLAGNRWDRIKHRDGYAVKVSYIGRRETAEGRAGGGESTASVEEFPEIAKEFPGEWVTYKKV